MFLERKTKARPERKNFHLKFSKTPSDNYIRLTDKKAQHVWFRKKKEKPGWLQLLSSGPAGLSSWFSQKKSLLILARDHASLGNKARCEYPQGKKSTILTVHKVSIFQC